MRVIVFAPYALKLRYFETELEIAQKHLDAGDDVTILTCHGALTECDMKQQRAYICVRCSGRSDFGLGMLDGDYHAESLYRLNADEQRRLTQFKTDIFDADELTRLQVDNFDIGWGVLSSLVSLHRDPDLNLRSHAAELDGLLRAAWTSYYSMRRRLAESPVDLVYAFNGRHAPMRAVLRACEAENVECILHERGHDIRHYELYRNAMPHDRHYHQQQIQLAWTGAQDRDDREAVGRQWFIDRTEGVEQLGVSFVTAQQADLLPEGWDPDRRNVAVFVSSENEFVAIGDSWKNPLYATQSEGLNRIVESLDGPPHDLHLFVRVHPNLQSLDTTQTRELARLSSPHVTVIPADDPVSTYALMQGCEKVLTFGSTTGIEAVYWRKASILAGMSLYRELGATYNPGSHDELMAMLRADLEPHDPLPALKYGFYHATFGRPYQHYVPETRYEGLFKGQRVRPTRRSWVKSRVVKLWGSAAKRVNRMKGQRAA